MSDDVVLAYLRRLRGMTDSPRLRAHIDEVGAERVEELAQRAGRQAEGSAGSIAARTLRDLARDLRSGAQQSFSGGAGRGLLIAADVAQERADEIEAGQ